MRIALISDIHGVASTYQKALRDARAEGFDRLLILGDLLTYGCEPERVIELTADAIDRDGAVLLCGNHDAIYRHEGDDGRYLAGLPDWIRESVDWTFSHRSALDAFGAFRWQEEWSFLSLYAAHANPFGVRDWTYLNSDESLDRACVALSDRGYSTGVFGHTHRARDYRANGARAITIGSTGQPRDRSDPHPRWAMASVNGTDVSLEHRPIEHDWAHEIAAIRCSSMSEATKNKLSSFYQ